MTNGNVDIVTIVDAMMSVPFYAFIIKFTITLTMGVGFAKLVLFLRTVAEQKGCVMRKEEPQTQTVSLLKDETSSAEQITLANANDVHNDSVYDVQSDDMGFDMSNERYYTRQ